MRLGDPSFFQGMKKADRPSLSLTSTLPGRMCKPSKQSSRIDRVEISSHLPTVRTFSFTQTAHYKPLTTNADVHTYMSMTNGDIFLG